MKLPKNLRSGFMQEDVEDYLYKLLPARDGVINDMEDLRRGTRGAHYRDRPWRACWRCWCRFPEPKEYLSWVRRSAIPPSGWRERRDRGRTSLIRIAIRKMRNALPRISSAQAWLTH